MDRRSRVACAWFAASLLLLVAGGARAASLQQVSNWTGGVSGLPSDVTMYIYVPDKVATNPPILTLVHYCGGTASAVFGQAQGGGVVKAADQYGFIIVAPSSGRCWDIVSSKTRTHDGGGDSLAIAQMVRYAITTYKADADRVYSTGDSSGGMMTELLLAVYPDIFKGGSGFAGMPAGCGTTTSSAGGYDGSCGGGNVTHTAQQWGDIVRAMDPGYTGHRGRLQLFHGDADGTISYKNLAESVKEWTNVLGLPTDPTSTETGLTLGTHKATRQRWQNSCGYVVLEAITSIGGDHGPSDALFNSSYVIPFLGLDKTGAVDPEIAACSGDAGVGGTGGASGTGGTGAGGTGGGRDGGPDGSRDVGSAGGAGGIAATGGSPGSGGVVGNGGASGSGGAPGSGGSGNGGNLGVGGSGAGGVSGKGGTPGSGGSQGSGGGGSGGAPGSGGVVGSGGGAASGGSAGQGSGGTSGLGGTGGSSGSTTTGGGSEARGCGCVLGGASSKQRGFLDAAVLIVGLALSTLVRRRRVRESRAVFSHRP
jgi:acetylxylan esterase